MSENSGSDPSYRYAYNTAANRINQRVQEDMRSAEILIHPGDITSGQPYMQIASYEIEGYAENVFNVASGALSAAYEYVRSLFAGGDNDNTGRGMLRRAENSALPDTQRNLQVFRGGVMLPIPIQGLRDEYVVNYNENFAWMSALRSPGAGRTLAEHGAGRYINEFRSITLDSPHFRNFALTWKLAPKSFQESQDIQRIYWKLRTEMTPETALGGAFFKFPSIFLLSFMPNPQFLYKFKPCVLKNITMDFTGGAGAPSFYNHPDHPPESVLLTTQWLELEYWLKGDYQNGATVDGLPSPNPFDNTRNVRG